MRRGGGVAGVELVGSKLRHYFLLLWGHHKGVHLGV